MGVNAVLFSQFLPDHGAADQRTFVFPLSGRERVFLLRAVAQFCATRCPLEIGEGECPMLTWRESYHNLGAIEKVCAAPPQTWIDRLAPEVPSEEL